MGTPNQAGSQGTALCPGQGRTYPTVGCQAHELGQSVSWQFVLCVQTHFCTGRWLPRDITLWGKGELFISPKNPVLTLETCLPQT